MMKSIITAVIVLDYCLIVSSSVRISVGVNSETQYAVPIPGKSTYQSAQYFCTRNQIEPIEKCIVGVDEELSRRCEAAFLQVSTEVEVDGKQQEIVTRIGEDPTSAATRWCNGHNIYLVEKCISHLSETLWRLLEDKHRIRLEECLDNNAEVSSLSDEIQQQRLELIRGSVSVLRLRVKLTHSLDAVSLELLGIGELLLGFSSRGESRLLQAVYIDPYLERSREILEEIRKIVGYDHIWRVSNTNITIDEVAINHIAFLKKQSGFYRETDCSVIGAGKDCPELRHERRKLPRIHISQLVDISTTEPGDQVVSRAVRGEIPFVLLGAMDGWDWTRQNSSHARWDYSGGRFLLNNPLVSRINQAFNHSLVEFFPGGIGTLGQFSPSVQPFGDAVTQLEHPQGYQPTEVDNTNEGAYIHWGGSVHDWKQLLHLFSVEGSLGVPFKALEQDEVKMLPSLFRDQVAWMEECFIEHPDDAQGKAFLDGFVASTRWFAAYVGEAGGGMFHHQDNHRTSAWQAQVQGIKRWHMCPPEQSHLMNGRGGIDVFNPDYENNPQFLEASCYDDVVHPGEMVFYPGQYWHATQTLSSPTVSLSSLLVDGHSWRHVMDRLRNDDCADSTDSAGEVKKASFPPQLCSRLEKCFDIFKAKFEDS